MVPTLIVYACVLTAVFVIKYAPEANAGSFAGALIRLFRARVIRPRPPAGSSELF